MKLSELFEEAVGCLARNKDEMNLIGKQAFSCSAITVAAAGQAVSLREALYFLQELGMNGKENAFRDFEGRESRKFSSDPTPRSQRARALLLTWAAMIAREEGL